MAVFREKTDLHYNYQIDLINKNSGIVVIKKITKEVFKMAQPAYLKYRLLNLPSTNVVQKVYVGATYVYALQLINSNTNVVISRIPKTNVTSTYDLDFSSGEQMYLNNFGHGQTWEYFSHNGEDYWWVVTKPNGGSENWGTQLARVQYSPNTQTDTPYNGNTSVTRLALLNHATLDGSSYGTLERVEGALSSDRATLLIAGLDTNGTSHFTLYDNEALNNAMDKVDANHGYVRLDEATSMLSTGVTTPYYSIANFRSVLTSSSVQGYDLSNGYAVYVSSGQAASDDHPNQDTPGVTKFAWGHTTGTQVELRNTNWADQNVETEGIQIGSSDLYIGISYHDLPYATKTLENRIYTADKSFWD